MPQDTITTATAPAIQAAHASHKRNVRLGKEAKAPFSAGKSPTEAKDKEPLSFPPLPSFSGSKPSAEALRTAEDMSDFGSEFGDLDGDDIDYEKEEAEALKRRTVLAAKINDYYREFPYTRPGGEAQKKPPSWSAADKEEKLKAEHDRIRFQMDSVTAKQTVRRIFVQAMSMAETVTMDADNGGWGINPLELDLEGLGTATQANLPQFEPELTEAAIEMREWLSTSWHVRLAFKAVAFTQAYSALKKDPKMMEHLREAQKAARASQAADADL